MTPIEFLHTIWICEPPKGALTVSDVEEAMKLYGEYLTKHKYSKKAILKAGEIGEVSMIDVKHVCSLLDEACNLIGENNKCTCMYCEKEVNYSSGIFTCEDCSK